MPYGTRPAADSTHANSPREHGVESVSMRLLIHRNPLGKMLSFGPCTLMLKCGMKRWIMHMDMDAFYASVEQLDHPEWRGRPVIVGGEERGVVSAASYEARKFGVHSAMPVFQARKLCPHAVFTRGSRTRYAEISAQIMNILNGYSPLVEQASIDEAYLDASGLERLFGPVEKLGRLIKDSVKEQTGLTCSIGIAPVKFLAKIASDMQKPDGLTIIRHELMRDFLHTLPLSRIPGLGKKTLAKLESYGISSMGDAQSYPPEFWERTLGKTGKAFYERCHGIDPREVVPYTEPKSESAENTFARDISDLDELKTWLLRQAERVGASLRKYGYKGRTITLKVKYADFTQITRSHSLKSPTNTTSTIYEIGARLLDELNPTRSLRLIGLGVSNFGQEEDAPPQADMLTLPGLKVPAGKKCDALPDRVDDKKQQALDMALDMARKKFGADAVVRGRLFGKDK